MRKSLILLCSILIGALAAGCGSNQPSKATTAVPQTATSANSQAVQYPLTVKTINSHGQLEDQVFTKAPERIVAMWQNSIETPLALGLGDKIAAGVGVPDKKYFLPENQEAYERIPIRGSRELDVETVLMQEPEIIIGWYSTFTSKFLRSTDFWHKRGIRTYTAISSSPLYNYRKLQYEWDDILNLGKIFNRTEKAEAIVKDMQNDISFVVNKTKHAPKKQKVLIMEYMGREVRVFNERTLAGDITNQLNGELLAAKETNISLEQIVDMDPDVIFTVLCEWDYGKEDKFVEYITKNPALAHLRCVKEKRIVPLHLGSIYAAGVRAKEGIHAIAQGMYPELYQGKE